MRRAPGCLRARAVVCPADRVVVARVINPTSQVVQVYKGTRLGRLEKLADSLIVSAVAAGPTAPEDVTMTGAPDAALWELVAQCNDEGQEQLMQVLQKHHKAFAAGPQDQGCTGRVQHHIHTGDSPPIHHSPGTMANASWADGAEPRSAYHSKGTG